MRRKFEYLEKSDLTVTEQNEFGAEGWELVTVIRGNYTWYYHFKRELI